ncbi:hypothetical protein [Brachyspira pilosicoli]|uniref:hypothetical protein n=1 Tax=Brachyspira pilosicoli TaxID=52584 RepID=UPI003003E180
MAIFGVGATFNNTEDVSKEFINNNVAGIGWGEKDAPDLHQFIQSLKVGDIIYIKSFAPKTQMITVKAIGIIIDDKIVKKFSIGNHKIGIGRNMKWINKKSFTIENPKGKHNVVNNSFYEEFNPEIQKAIIDRI